MSARYRKHRITHAMALATSTDLTLVDGGSGMLTATFGEPVTPKPLTLNYMRGAYDADYPETLVYGDMAIVVAAHPGDISTYNGTTNLAVAGVEFSDYTRSTQLDESIDVVFGDPFPTDWARALVTFYVRAAAYRIPGPSPDALALFAGSSRVLPFDANTTPSIGGTPTIHPPKNIRVGDPGTLLGDGGTVMFDGVSPLRITWDEVPRAPNDSPTRYVVTVHALFNDAAGVRTTAVAVLTTAATSIAVPADVFAEPGYFGFTVSADRSLDAFGDGVLGVTTIPSDHAVSAPGIFRLSTRCGDGIVDSPEEECDTMGRDTPSCDRDCSLPRCGDGLKNASAAEICDTGAFDTIACDADCTIPECGDGRLNRNVEDCDDSTPGSGCMNCRLMGFCGDGIRQSFDEDCDAFANDTSGCDADCTTVMCGDGHLNLNAVPVAEACDDGNTLGGDGCSSTCTVE